MEDSRKALQEQVVQGVSGALLSGHGHQQRVAKQRGAVAAAWAVVPVVGALPQVHGQHHLLSILLHCSTAQLVPEGEQVKV